jgi:hypothetical protein
MKVTARILWAGLIFLLTFKVFAGPKDDLELMAQFLKNSAVSTEDLEKKYSCMSLDEMLKKGLANISDLEKAVVSSRKNTRVAGLLPEISAWGKYKSDEKLYLYQRNNIAVGKDYITVGPDENNTTFGDIQSWEVGGRIKFDLTKLVYNPDTIKFSDQEQKLYFLKIEMVDKLSYVYYFQAMLNALQELKVKVPEEKLLILKIRAQKHSGWFKSVTGFDLKTCGKKGDRNEK